MNWILNRILAIWEAYSQHHRNWTPYRQRFRSYEHPRDINGKSLRTHRIIMRRMVNNRWEYRALTAEEARREEYEERQNSSW
jgi:hypothetical protein